MDEEYSITSENTAEEPLPDLSQAYQIFATAILGPIAQSGLSGAPVIGWSNYYSLFGNGRTYFDYVGSVNGLKPEDLSIEGDGKGKGCYIRIADWHLKAFRWQAHNSCSETLNTWSYPR